MQTKLLTKALLATSLLCLSPAYAWNAVNGLLGGETDQQKIDGHLKQLQSDQTSILTAINNLIGGYGQGLGAQALTNTKTPMVTEIMAATIQIEPNVKIIKDKTNTGTDNKISKYLMSPNVTAGSGSNSGYTAGPGVMTYKVAGLSGTDYHVNGGNQKTYDNSSFLFTSLIGPLQYDQNKTGYGNVKDAENYLDVLFQMGGNALVIKKGLTDPDKVWTNPKFIKYLEKYRGLVAAYSMVVDNFLTMKHYRDPIKGLGTQVGMKDENNKPIADASLAAAENYLAVERLNSDWYKKMETANPITVQRETLYLLAEMRYEMHRMRQDNERLLAAVSAQQLQSLVNYRETTLSTACSQLGSDYCETSQSSQVNQLIGTSQSQQAQQNSNPSVLGPTH